MKIWYRVLFICAAGFSLDLAADSHLVEVLGHDGQAIAGAVVYLEPLDAAAEKPVAPAIMDQVDRQFFPHILVVQRGAEVAFPNSDSIKHHVYSFSPSKTFQIKLYKGVPADPVVFAMPGEVELGCNVHDWMLGYIYVVDTPFFARTDASGIAMIDAPSGSYTLGTWHPQIQDAPDALRRETERGVRRHQIRLARPLLAPYDAESADEFADYD